MSDATKQKRHEVLALRDAMDDLLNGFRLWRDSKVSAADLDDKDEQFIRWVEAGPSKDHLA